jgi:HrpA-like RNA helicase
LAAIALAKRVADEMGTNLGETVAYQVRHEASSLNENNCIKVNFS